MSKKEKGPDFGSRALGELGNVLSQIFTSSAKVLGDNYFIKEFNAGLENRVNATKEKRGTEQGGVEWLGNVIVSCCETLGKEGINILDGMKDWIVDHWTKAASKEDLETVHTAIEKEAKTRKEAIQTQDNGQAYDPLQAIENAKKLIEKAGGGSKEAIDAYLYDKLVNGKE